MDKPNSEKEKEIEAMNDELLEWQLWGKEAAMSGAFRQLIELNGFAENDHFENGPGKGKGDYLIELAYCNSQDTAIVRMPSQGLAFECHDYPSWLIDDDEKYVPWQFIQAIDKAHEHVFNGEEADDE